jgi:hypothetical protein
MSSYNKIKTHYKTFKTHETPMFRLSEGYLSRVTENQKNEDDKKTEIERLNDEEIEKDKAKGVTKKTEETRVKESNMLFTMNNLSKEYKKNIFNDILFEMFIKANPLDTDFKKEYSKELKETFNDFVKAYGGYELLESHRNIKSNYVLDTIKNTCTKITTEVCNRKISENDSNPDIVNLSMTDEERSKYLDMKDDISIDTISQLVKDKLLLIQSILQQANILMMRLKK